MRNSMFLFSVCLLALTITGCVSPYTVTPVYNADRAFPERLADEGTVLFVRPAEYSVFGTESIRDYVEVTYERAARNSADLLKVELGLRNRGGQRFYDTIGPNFHLSVKTAFYDRPLSGGTPQAAPVYETNWQTVKLLRGATEHFQVVCPVRAGGYYQVTISEPIGQ